MIYQLSYINKTSTQPIQPEQLINLSNYSISSPQIYGEYIIDFYKVNDEDIRQKYRTVKYVFQGQTYIKYFNNISNNIYDLTEQTQESQDGLPWSDDGLISSIFSYKYDINTDNNTIKVTPSAYWGYIEYSHTNEGSDNVVYLSTYGEHSIPIYKFITDLYIGDFDTEIIQLPSAYITIQKIH